MSANTTEWISLHPTRTLSYTAVTGSTKELSIRTGTYNDTLAAEIDFADDLVLFIFALYDIAIVVLSLSQKIKDRTRLE